MNKQYYLTLSKQGLKQHGFSVRHGYPLSLHFCLDKEGLDSCPLSGACFWLFGTYVLLSGYFFMQMIFLFVVFGRRKIFAAYCVCLNLIKRLQVSW